jgi:hypothetical protein
MVVRPEPVLCEGFHIGSGLTAMPAAVNLVHTRSVSSLGEEHRKKQQRHNTEGVQCHQRPEAIWVVEELEKNVPHGRVPRRTFRTIAAAFPGTYWTKGKCFRDGHQWNL